MKSVLLHLGTNMWDDFLNGPDDLAKSVEEEKLRPNPFGPDSRGKRSRYRSYLRCDDTVWKEAVDSCAQAGMNAVFIDIGEGMAFPSHPELAVKGTWSVEKMQKELARIRSLGMEPLPKLNFSACHDSWLKEYHRMLSTKEYYQVVAAMTRSLRWRSSILSSVSCVRAIFGGMISTTLLDRYQNMVRVQSCGLTRSGPAGKSSYAVHPVIF